jgi:hypothetical protein
MVASVRKGDVDFTGIIMKFKVGDRVRIKPASVLISAGNYETSATPTMLVHAGKITTIIAVGTDEYHDERIDDWVEFDVYDLDVDNGNHYWTEDMLEKITNLPCPFRCPYNDKGKCKKRGCRFFKDYKKNYG